MIIDITKATIFEKNINNNLWLEFILIIIYVKNNQPTRALQNNLTFD